MCEASMVTVRVHYEKGMNVTLFHSQCYLHAKACEDRSEDVSASMVVSHVFLIVMA